MLPQYFSLERVALLTTHRRDVERIIPSGQILDRLLRPAMHPGDPGVRSPVGAVRVIRPNPCQVGSDDLVGPNLGPARRDRFEGVRVASRASPERLHRRAWLRIRSFPQRLASHEQLELLPLEP